MKRKAPKAAKPVTKTPGLDHAKKAHAALLRVIDELGRYTFQQAGFRPLKLSYTTQAGDGPVHETFIQCELSPLVDASRCLTNLAEAEHLLAAIVRKG